MLEYLGYAELPSDILITNQLVAGLRTYAFQPFEAMRGRMMMSETGFSRSGQFAAYSVVSTFPFVNDLGDLNKLGPDPSFDVANATRYTALILAGEIGSLLLRFTINLTNPSCVTFSAPPGQMRAHLDALDPGKYQRQRASHDPRCLRDPKKQKVPPHTWALGHGNARAQGARGPTARIELGRRSPDIGHQKSP